MLLEKGSDLENCLRHRPLEIIEDNTVINSSSKKVNGALNLLGLWLSTIQERLIREANSVIKVINYVVQWGCGDGLGAWGNKYYSPMVGCV